jgi:protein gp37
MKLMNTIVVLDVYVAVDDAAEPQDAVNAVIALVQTGELAPSTTNVLEVTKSREIRAAWLKERPIVGASVADADFEKLKGKTVEEVFAMLHEAPAELK